MEWLAKLYLNKNKQTERFGTQSIFFLKLKGIFRIFSSRQDYQLCHAYCIIITLYKILKTNNHNETVGNFISENTYVQCTRNEMRKLNLESALKTILQLFMLFQSNLSFIVFSPSPGPITLQQSCSTSFCLSYFIIIIYFN